MPQMTGGEFAAAARDLRPDLPIVLVTGLGEAGSDLGRAHDVVLAKPYSGCSEGDQPTHLYRTRCI